MSLDLKYPRVCLLPQFLHLKAALVRMEWSTSHLFSYTISLKTIIWTDFQAVTPGNLLIVLLHQQHLYYSPSFSCRLGTEVTCSYSDESSSAPRSVLKSSDVTRERCRHVTVLVFGWCERGFGSAFWEPHKVLSGATGPNLSFMCFHKEQATDCGFLNILTISLFSGWCLIQEFIGIIANS